MQMTFTGERYVPQLRGQIYYEHLHRYALALSLAGDKDVLDIASGEGYGSALLAMVARSVVGVDIDESSVRYAGSRYTAMNLSFRSGSATQIPIADASVDLVVSFETIEHLVEHERMFAEFKRVLRPAGRLIISSPNKLIYSDARAYTNPYHVRELYFHELRDTLKDFFPAVRLFGHRIFAGSAVHPLNEISQATKWLGPSTKPENGISSLPDPEYFIAVCSTEAKDELPDLSSVYLDPRDNLLDDVRSGGLAAGDAQPGVLEAGPLAQLSAAPLSLGHADAHRQTDSTRDGTVTSAQEQEELAERIHSIEKMRSDEHNRADELEERLRNESSRAESLHGELALVRQEFAANRLQLSELEDSFLATSQNYEDESRLRRELQLNVDRLTKSEEQSRAELRKLQRREGELRLTLESARDELGEVRRACHQRDLEAHVFRVKLAEDAAFIDELARRSVELRDENQRLRAQASQARANDATMDGLNVEIELIAMDRQRVLGLLMESLERSATLQRVSDAMLNSKSWTMTKPIRRAAAALSRR